MSDDPAGTVLGAAGAVLQELLTDVWGDDDVAPALDSLHHQPAAVGLPLLTTPATAAASDVPAPATTPANVQVVEMVLDSAVLSILQDAAGEDAAAASGLNANDSCCS